jgi:ATP-dependent Lhr-like helicase
MDATPIGELELLTSSHSVHSALNTLSEPVRRWFVARFGSMTCAQRLAWPAVHQSKNLLLSSPTGSGKTLAAFLPILSRLWIELPAGGTRCLYVTPLKALANDVRRNLRRHIKDLRAWAPADARAIRVGLRTGDTPDCKRRKLLRMPPDILLTTPESLAILLSQPLAAGLFVGLRWVVADELHALAPNKRGSDLSVSLERLEQLAGGRLQRIGLSATCSPIEEAARFLVGTDRPCALAQVSESAPLELTIEPLEGGASFLQALVARLRPEIAANRTTLIFTNRRSLAERLTWILTRQFPAWAGQIGVHHSSLAADRRRAVERRLKQGELRVVVSSTSLELGIDIGPVDGVVLVHPPGDVVRLLQRVGRAGHGPGRVRRGLVLTSTPDELLEAVVTGASSRGPQCEPLRVARHPLDVLCQQLLGMAAQCPWSADDAFGLVRRAYPYRDLSRFDFDSCLRYLSGQGEDGRPWLPSRLRWQGGCFAIQDERTARILRRNIGSIIADESRQVLLEHWSIGGSSANTATGDLFGFARPEHSILPPPPQLVGEVEEAFADRLKPGDRFLLEGRCLELRRIEGPALVVEERPGRPAVPRWGGDGWPLSTELAERLYLLRVQAAEALREGRAALADLLHRDYGLRNRAVETLIDYFQRQECLSEIPEKGVCLVEIVRADRCVEYYVHTPLNRLANDAVARVAVWRLARQCGLAATSIVADLGFVFTQRSGAELAPDDFRQLLRVERFDEDLNDAIADSHTLCERFRRVAMIGLMVLRNPLGQRRRVGGIHWAERRLFTQVSETEPEFVLLRQARREVGESCCDASAARAFLSELPRWTVRYRRLAQVSPFAQGWTQIEAGPSESVDNPAEVLRRLHAALTGNEENHASAYRLAVDA